MAFMITERTKEQAALIELTGRLAALVHRCNGRLGQNPYAVPEYREALVTLKKVTGFTGHAYDVNVAELRKLVDK